MTFSEIALRSSTPNISPKPVILAFETGIKGGSIALFMGETELDGWVGEGRVSRSEDILAETDRILSRNAVEKNVVDVVVTSAGPGSFTGLRIGVAFAKGFCKSVGARHVSRPLLEMLSLSNKLKAENFAAAVPFGRNQIAWQLFKGAARHEKTPVRVSTEFEFTESIYNLKVKNIYCHHSLFELIDGFKKNALLRSLENNIDLNIVDAGKNMAARLARNISASAFEKNLSPAPSVDLIYPIN